MMDPRLRRLLTALSAALMTGATLLAQQNQPDATVTFKFYWSEANPSQYTIVVHQTGQARYESSSSGLTSSQERNTPVESNAEQTAQSEDAASQETYRSEFRGSDALLKKVFTLAERMHFFDGDFDYRKHQIAQNGRKTLAYDDPSRHTSTTYNWSEETGIQELTAIFQGISETIEGGRKLDFDRRFDKLALDSDLSGLEQLSADGKLQEIQVIAPILQQLVNDRTVLHIARQRAERILRKAGQPLAQVSR